MTDNVTLPTTAIPLTPEILEKNGFGYKEEDSYYIHFYQGERCYIANSDLHIGTNIIMDAYQEGFNNCWELLTGQKFK